MPSGIIFTVTKVLHAFVCLFVCVFLPYLEPMDLLVSDA